MFAGMCAPALIVLLLVCLSLLTSGSSYLPETHQAARLICYSYDEEFAQDPYVTLRYGRTAGSRADVYTNVHGDELKSYHPDIFQKMRSCAGVSEELYRDCLNPDYLECLIDRTDSKSGQAFWRSSDPHQTTILKTIKRYECTTMREMLHAYAAHMEENRQSCISMVLGLYRVRLKKTGKKLYFVAMRNVFSATDGGAVTEPTLRFDLKGSTAGRAKNPTSSVLKDLDLLELVSLVNSGSSSGSGSSSASGESAVSLYRDSSSYEYREEGQGQGQGQRQGQGQGMHQRDSAALLFLGDRPKRSLMNALVRDVQFLSRFKLIDYSLLVQIDSGAGASGFEDKNRDRDRDRDMGRDSGSSSSSSRRGRLTLAGQRGQVTVGIIDFLQRYTLRKRLETVLKGLFFAPNTISCAPPRRYAARMCTFIASSFFPY